MPTTPAPWPLGPLLAQDAVGTWHRVDVDGVPRTLRRLHAELAGRADARLLFEEEARRIVRLDHPALLRVHAHDLGDPLPWMLADAIDGTTLADAVPPGRAVAAPEALRLTLHLVGGLAALEPRRQVHVAPWPIHASRVEDGWRWHTFRLVRAQDELRALKGRTPEDPTRAPPEVGGDHPEPVRPGPWVSWAAGALLRHLLGAGAPQDAAGRALPLPSRLGRPLGPLVALLTHPQPRRRPPDVASVLRLLEDPSRAEPEAPAAAPPPRGPAPVPRRRRER